MDNFITSQWADFNKERFFHFTLLKPFIFAFILLTLSPSVSADTDALLQAKPLLKEFKIQVFNDSRLVSSEFGTREAHYRLALGSIRKVRDQIRLETEIRLSGEINHLTFEIDRRYSPAEIYQFFFEQINTVDHEILYKCRSSECGSNILWANQIFKQRLLNGRELSQQYVAGRLAKANATTPAKYFVFYLIQSGNRRIYLHFDLITVHGQDEDPVLDSLYYYEQLKTLKRVRVRGLSIDKDLNIDSGKSKNAIKTVERLLQGHPELKLAIVGHTHDMVSIEKNQQNALRLAENFKALLNLPNKQNIIPAFGIGPLAPRTTGNNGSPTVWIELVQVPLL